MFESHYDLPAINQFIERWSSSSAHERAVYQQFFIEFCDLLGVERPDPSAEARPDYCFEKPVVIAHKDGRETTRFIDFYKKDYFVLEAKQGSEVGDASIGTARRGTGSWDKALRGAYGQALKYASYLPEGKPPFLLTCDIGHVFEIWTGFSGDYRSYGARRTIELAQLADRAVFEYFVKIFTDPHDLDPARHAQRVTREVAGKLAELARVLEENGHDPELVAQFLMRCIFTMFAEDVGLLPKNLFTDAIKNLWIPTPRLFQPGVEQLWKAMKDGLPFGFVGKLLRFNGGLFSAWQSLKMTPEQLHMLLNAAKCDWSSVEPAIFGTLVERALNPFDRKKLGAHFTPREYIERLVRPTVIEPLRAEWEIAQAETQQILNNRPTKKEVEWASKVLDEIKETNTFHSDVTRKKWEKEAGKARRTIDLASDKLSHKQKQEAAKPLQRFHDKLVATCVLDPACGSGNFLYVTLDLFKEIEAEVLRELGDLLGEQFIAENSGNTVNPGQFLGIEINPRAREIADLVLWIGYLQWYRRTYGDLDPPEPVLKPYKNIVCRDAVLEYDDIKPRLDDNGKPLEVWDMRTYKTHPVTGKQVPDENARVAVLDYVNPRPAEWPEAEYVVSNPPFVGNWRMRHSLGEGYAETVRKTYPDIPESCDYVMYWWEKAAELVRKNKIRRYGFITTNSLRQKFNRRVLARHIEGKPPLSLSFAIPDHPWVDSADGAAVRIAMTVGEPEIKEGRLFTVVSETETGNIAISVSFSQQTGIIHADLTVGVDATQTTPLFSNQNLANRGYCLFGSGFILTPVEAEKLGKGSVPELDNYIGPYLNGKDLMHKPRGVMVIDLYGLDAEEVRNRFPATYQRVLERVKPERDTNKRASRRKYWWIFGEPNPKLRNMLDGLPRYITTTETAKHRVFQFLDAAIRPDNMLVNVALDDAWFLGTLSSRFHVTWALTSGGDLGPTPRYNKTRCFDPFPFPEATDEQQARIRDLGERLDAHRKRVQAEHPDVTLTAMYNALERLRTLIPGSSRAQALTPGPSPIGRGENNLPSRPSPRGRGTGEAQDEGLTDKERAFHDRALIGILKQIHDKLDAAVADAYGWPVDLPDEEILERLVALNHERTEEEKNGLIRWLRPDFQNPDGKRAETQKELTGIEKPKKAAAPAKQRPWPKAVNDQLRAIRDLFASRAGTLSVADVALQFKRAHRNTIRRHLETLESLGLLVSYEENGEKRWNPLAE